MSVTKMILMVVLMVVLSQNSFAQTGLASNKGNSGSLKIFMSGIDIDLTSIRLSIPYIDMVIDQSQADVQVISTAVSTASGGKNYRLEFIGKEDFSSIRYELNHTSQQEDTELIRRKHLIAILKAGLAPYLCMIAKPDELVNDFNGASSYNEAKIQNNYDSWNSWLVTLRLNGEMYKDENYSNLDFGVLLGIDRITDLWKIDGKLHYTQNTSRYTEDEEEISSISSGKGAQINVVKSLNSRWSAGISSNIFSSSFLNKASSYIIAPAVEYNVFPWSEVDRRVFTIAYRIGVEGNTYFEKTIFNKMKETLGVHSLVVDYKSIQPWGEAGVELVGSQFFNTPELYSFGIGGWYETRISKYVAFDIWINWNTLHDQIYLPAGDAALEDVLLRRRSMSTTFQYSVGIGLNFKIGSIYNNIVNKRLESKSFGD